MAEAKKENFFARTGKGLSRWWREMKSELKKVVWPTKEQIVNNTLIVFACTLVVGIFIWVFDAVGGVVVNGIITLCKG
jgi:preprotein translocase subunit SecE